jgi:ATP-binding cassette subfamily B protein
MTLSKNLTFRRALGIPFSVTPAESVLQIIHNIVNLALAPVSILVTAYFIDTALAVFNEGLDRNLIIPPIIFLTLMQVYHYLMGPLMGLIGKKREIKTRLALRVPFVEKRVRLEYKHIENNDTMDLINRVWENPEGKLSEMLDNLVWFVVMIGQTASYIAILLINATLAGSVLIIFSAPIFYIAMKSGKHQYQALRDMTKRDRMFWTVQWFLTSRETAHERNMFGYTPFLNKKYTDAYEESRKHKTKVDVKWFIRSKSSAIILGLLSASALFILVPSVVNGHLTVGLYISIMGGLFASIHMIGWSLPNTFQQFASHREFIKDVNQFLDLSEAEGADHTPAEAAPAFQSLELRNVSFTYPGTEKKILDTISLVIEKGKNYSFVGVNGAGKTTLTKLITRLYEDYTGEILLNGKDLREYPMNEVKATFCAVFQDFARYDVTVAENIAVGKINGAAADEIDRSIKLSGFEEKLKELKDGKDTLLGKTQDEGVDLSGGEWQRVAFARAVLSPCPVKILDEPTAALDPVAESKVYAQFEEISKGITTIFISHRLASAKLADTIFVLDGGKLAEQGSHDDLMAKDGLYAEMFESQRSWYV